MLEQILEASDDIVWRFEKINAPEDFQMTPENRTIKDAIFTSLTVIGETLKKVDKKTDGQLLARYPEVPWQAAMRMRDVIAHHYFKVMPEVVFGVCQDDIPELRKTLAKMLEEICPVDGKSD